MTNRTNEKTADVLAHADGQASTTPEETMNNRTSPTFEEIALDTLAGYSLAKLCPGLPAPGDPDEPVTLGHLSDALEALADVEEAETILSCIGMRIGAELDFPGAPAALRFFREEGIGDVR